MSSTTNKEVIEKFFDYKGAVNSYGRSMFVHNKVLYSCAEHVLVGIDPYHVELDGTPARNAIPIACFTENVLLTIWYWDGRFMTLNDHVKSVERHSCAVNKISAYYISPRSLEDHTKNILCYCDWAIKELNKASRARTCRSDYLRSVKDIMSEATRYCNAFGLGLRDDIKAALDEGPVELLVALKRGNPLR
jgi:hypothetical protein